MGGSRVVIRGVIDAGYQETNGNKEKEEAGSVMTEMKCVKIPPTLKGGTKGT